MSINFESKNITDLNIDILANNLRFLMNKSNIDSQKIYDATGIAVTTINNLRRSQGNPTLSTLQTLAEYFGVTIGDLTEKDLSNQERFKNSASEITLIDFNDVDCFFSEDNLRYKKSISIEIDPFLKENVFAVKLTNSAMAPFFEKGTIFVVSKNDVAHDGDLVLVKFGKSPACFRRIFIEDNSYFFSQITEMFEKEPFKSKNFSIYGIVLKAIQNFHE